VPEKIIGRFALILDFFDRCAETTCASSAPGGAWLFRPTSDARRSHNRKSGDQVLSDPITKKNWNEA